MEENGIVELCRQLKTRTPRRNLKKFRRTPEMGVDLKTGVVFSALKLVQRHRCRCHLHAETGVLNRTFPPSPFEFCKKPNETK